MRAFSLSRMQPLGLALSLALAYPAAHALPQGAQVVQGQVAINPGLIQQASDKAIVNWQSFSIAAGETLRVQQPGVNSVLLNRVVGGDPSLILGQLQANGRVFLVNPRGIVFGRGSQVDVGGLVASTLNLSDTDFLAGSYRFSAGSQAGALQADGRITATGGTVALIAPQLSVGGSIEARRVGLAAASTVQVDVEGDGLVLFNLRNDDDRDVALKFSGRVLAEGGSAELRAQARAGAAGQVLNMDGLVQARGFSQQGGRIVIDGGTAGITTVNGSLDATGERGGNITVLGQKLALLDGARLDASGRLGGGSLEVGGGFKGEGTAHNAERTWIGAGAELRADATEQGDGGRIAVWADQRTDMFGSIWARGGALGGNGGMVETSGRQRLNLFGRVDASAPRGLPGQWLLDPNDIAIVPTGPGNSHVGAAPNFSSTDDSAVVDVLALNTALTGNTTVTVETTTGPTSVQSGNIDVQAAIVSTGQAKLVLKALGNINFSTGSIGAGAGALDVDLRAPNGSITGTTINTGGGTLTATSSGAISLGTVTSSTLTILGGSGTVTLPGGSVAGALDVTTGGAIAQGGALTVGGLATLSTTAAAAVTLGSFDSHGLGITTAGGPITLGTGTITGNLSATSGGALITQAAGGLTVTGTAGFNAGAGAITLTEANDLRDTVTLTGAATHIVSNKTATRELKIGTSNISSTLIATTGGGDITQTGTLTVSGTATLDAGSGDITLAGLSTGLLTAATTAGNVTLGTGTVAGLNASTSGTGAITQASGSLAVNGAATLAAGSGGVTLGTFSSNGLDISATTGSLTLGIGTITGTLIATTGGAGTIGQAGALSVTSDVTLTTATGAVTLGSFGGGGDLGIVSTSGSITLGTGNIAGALTASTGGAGAITQAVGGLTVGGATTLAAGGGGVTLSSFSGHGLDVSATTGALTLGAGTITGTLIATTGGAGTIGQIGALSVTGNATLTTGTGAVTLGTFGSGGDLGIGSTSGSIRLGTGTISGTVTASTGGAGAITQIAGGMTAGGLSTLTAGSGGVTLSSVDSQGLSVSASNAAITLGAGAITGALTVNSGGGDISQAGALSVTGNTTLTAGAGSVTLGSFGSSGNLGISSTAGAITLGTGNITGTLTATTAGTGAITQAGGGLTAGGLATLTAGSGGITLSSFDSLGLTANASNAGITLGAGTITGALTATTTGAGTISQAGAITVTSGASLTTGTGAITLGTANITGALTASTGGAGAITQTGSGITAGGLATLTAGSGGVTLTSFDSHGLSVTASGGGVTLGAGTITGNLGASSGGTLITQAAGGLTVTGTSSLNAGAGAITLGAANDLQDTVSLTGAATTIISNKTAASVLKLGASNISSTLVATTGGGAITQAAGSLSVTGSATLNAGAGDILLGGLSTGALSMTSTAGNLRLGTGTVAGLTASTGGSGSITQAAGGLTVTGGATLTSSTGAITLGSFSSGNFSATTAGGALTLGTGTITGTMGVLTGGGNVGQAAGGLTVTSTSSLNTGAGDITLDQANHLNDTITLTGRTTQLTSAGATALKLASVTTTGNLGLTTAGGDIEIGPGSVTGTLTASSSGGAITQTAGSLSVTGLSTLNAGAGSIALGNFGSGGLSATTAGGTLTLGTGTLTGTLTAVTGGGTIDQIAGGLVVAGLASLNAGAAAITLNDAANNWGAAVSLTGGTTQLTSTRTGTSTLTLGALNITGDLTVSTAGGALNLGGGNVTGTLDASTLGGAIGQTAALSVTGIATLDATIGGDIILANTSNQWHGLNLTGKSLDLRSSSDLEILSLVQPSNQALTLLAGADLILGPAASIDTGTADLKLASLGGSFLVGGVLKGHDIELEAHTSLSLSQNITATGNLKLTTASVGISQTAGTILVAGTTTVSSGGTPISLARPTNDFTGAVSLAGGTTSVTDLNALTLGTLATGNLTVSSTGPLSLGKGTVTGTLNVNSHGGAITQATGAGAGLTLTGATTLSVGAGGTADITLDEATNNLQGAITAIGGAVSLRSANNLNLFALTQPSNKALVLEAGGTLTLPSGTTNIDTGTAALTLSSGGVFSTFGTLKGGNVTLKGQSATLGHDITASGNLDLRTTAGAITQNGGRISVAGTSLFNAGGSGITLNRSLNDFQGNVSLTGTSAGIVSLHDLTLATMAVNSLQAQAGGALQLGTGTLSGSLTATAGGSITQAAGGLRVTGNSSFSSSATTLLDTANAWGGAVSLSGGTTQLYGSGAVMLGGGSVSSLTLTAPGGVSQSAAVGVGGALTINAGSASILLGNGSNQLNGSVTLSGGTTQIATAGALSLGNLSVGALTLQSGGNLNLGQGTIGGNLLANSGGGAVTQSGLLSVSGTADIQAGSGSITLTQGGNQWGGVLSLAGGVAQVTSNAGLSLGTLAVGSLSADATGPLSLGQGSVAGSLTANSHGGTFTQSGALDVGGPAALQAGGGGITLTQAGNRWRGVVQLSGGATQITGAGVLSLGTLATGNLSAISTGALNLGQGTIGGNLLANSGGVVIQAGALQVNGSTTINAGSADITLTNTGNRFLGPLNLTGNAVSLFNRPNLVLGALSFNSLDATSNGSVTLGSGSLTGPLTARALGGTITQTAGGITAGGTTTLQASGAITLTEAANRLQGKVNLSGGNTALSNAVDLGLGNVATGALTLNVTGALDLGSGSIAGNLAATSSGALTQAGALAVSGSSTLDAGSAAITLGQAGNAFAGPVSLRGGNTLLTNGGALSLASLNVGDLTVQSSGPLRLGTGSVSGALKAGSGGAAITQAAGGLSVGGTATLDAGSASIQLGDAGNALAGIVNLNAGDVALVNRIALRLGSFTVRDLTVSAGGDLDLGGGTVNGKLVASSGGTQISQAGPLTVAGSASFTAGNGAVRLGGFTTGDLSITAGSGIELGGGTVNGLLVADTSGGQINQTGLLAVVGSASFTAGGGAVRLGSFSSADLTIHAGGDINLGGSSVNGNLLASTQGTLIGQTGALTVKGASTFIADGSLVDLVLDQPGNQLLGAITMRGINGGSFVGANLSSALDLSFSGDVRTLSLSSGGRLTLGGGRSTTLTAAAKTGIVQTGALEVSGQTTLIAKGGAAMPVDLNHAGNDFNRVALQSQSGGSFGAVQLRDGDASRHDGLRIGGDASSLEITSAGALDLAGGSHASLVADTAATGAAITQSGALAVSGLTTLKAGSGSITLARADNVLPSFTVASAGVASLVSAGGYTVNASNVSTRLELGGPGAITLAGPLSGSGELLMSGSGSLTITTAQSYTGGTRIPSGRVVLQGTAAQAGSGAVQLGAAGQLDLRDGATLASELVAQGGDVLNTSGSGTLAGAVTLQATTSFLPGAGGLTISGAISDAGAGLGLRLAGAGTLTLAGSNHYSGTTDIAAGALRATGAGALPVTSAVQLAAGAVLALGQDQAIGSLAGAGRVELGSFTLATGADGRDTSFSGSVFGSGGLSKLGSGRFTLAGSGAHTGATRVEAGELVLASAGALNDITAVTVDAGALLTIQQSTGLGSLAGAGTVNLQAAQLGIGSNGSSTRWDGAITGSGGLAKLGAGTFTLAGHNTFAGDLQVNAGTLQLEGVGVRPFAASVAAVPVVPAAAGFSVAGGATLELLSDQVLGALSGSGRVLLNPFTLTLGASGRDSRFDGVISGSGGLVKQGVGTLALGGANLFTGSTRVAGGTLTLDVAQALAGASALVIDAPARVQVNAAQTVASLNGAGSLALNGATLASGADGADSQFDGVASGSGGLVKQGAGTMTLTAANSYGGGTVIEAGTVRLNGQGGLGSGEIQNQGQLRLERSDAFTLAPAITGRGSLVITQGQVTLANGGNSYSGATQVLGGSLITTAVERLPDASAVQIAAGAQLQLGGNETLFSLQAAGSVRLAGNLTTRAEQVYTGSLTLANPAGITLSGTLIDASRSTNQFAGTPLSLSGGQALVTVKEALKLGGVSLSSGGRIEAERLALDGKLQLTGGSLAVVATAAPDDAKATLVGTAQVPVVGQPMAVAEATIQQGTGGAITLAEGASLAVAASGGGSVLLGQDANSFKGQLSVLSGAKFDTAWVPNAKGSQAIQSLVRVAGQQVLVGGSGIEADTVNIRADQLATVGSAKLVARMPFDEIVLGRALSAPGMTLELAPGAFGVPGSFGSVNGQPIQIAVGSAETGSRTTGPNAGYLTVLPKAGAQGATAVVLVGPKVGSAPATGGSGYRFFHDGASQATEVPVVYNGVLPLTPAASGAISSINGDAEDARRARFQETVRTENVTVRLRSGVIAEVGPGRPSTQGSEGATPPAACDPSTQPLLSCK